TTGGGWQQLAGSASEGGITNTATSSRRPSLTLDAAGNPIVAWTEFLAAGGNEIRVASYSPSANGGAGGWVAVGSGISGNAADNPILVNTAGGPIVGWLDS